jgi:phosphate starvation-inducible membrane PsiE
VEEIKKLKERLGRAFEVKDLGPLRYFLEIEIARLSKGIVISHNRSMSLIYWQKQECLGVVHVTHPLIRITNLC